MNSRTKKITTIGMMCAMAMVMNLLLHFPIIPAVSFLNYDPKDIVIVIASFIYGPFSAFVMSAICAVLDVMFRGGTILDVLMNMIATCMFSCVAGAIYKKEHTKKGALIGLGTGVILTTISMLLWNYIITPIYFGISREAVAAMLIPGILPFNLIKYGINAGASLFLYKPVIGALRSSHLVMTEEKPHEKSNEMVVLGAFIVISLVMLILGYQGII